MFRRRHFICAPVAILLIVFLTGSLLASGNALLHEWLHDHENERETHQCAAKILSQKQFAVSSPVETPARAPERIDRAVEGRIVSPAAASLRLDFSRGPPSPVVFHFAY